MVRQERLRLPDMDTLTRGEFPGDHHGTLYNATNAGGGSPAAILRPRSNAGTRSARSTISSAARKWIRSASLPPVSPAAGQ